MRTTAKRIPGPGIPRWENPTAATKTPYQIYVTSLNGSSARQLTIGTVDAVEPSWSPDGKKILYSVLANVNPNGPYVPPNAERHQIWTMNRDGSDQTNLSRSNWDDISAKWSPDGGKIAFRRGTRCYPSRGNNMRFDLFVMNADGSRQTDLTTSIGCVSTAAWSPDGSRLAFERKVPANDGTGYDHADLWVISADGSGQANLTNALGHLGTYVWSPDGSRIAFEYDYGSEEGIYVATSDGRTLQKIADGSHPRWASSTKVLLIKREGEGVDFPITSICSVTIGNRRARKVGSQDYNEFWPVKFDSRVTGLCIDEFDFHGRRH